MLNVCIFKSHTHTIHRPTLAGWDAAGRILYTEQSSVSINLYAMDAATLHSWSQIKIVGGEAGPVAAAGQWKIVPADNLLEDADGLLRPPQKGGGTTQSISDLSVR